jgi:hypothetical protein
MTSLLKSQRDEAVPGTPARWLKPEVRKLKAGAAEAGGGPTTEIGLGSS